MKKPKLEDVLLVTMVIFLALVFLDGCKANDALDKAAEIAEPDPEPKPEVAAPAGTKLYEEKSAFTIPFTNTRFGCFKLSSVTGEFKPKPSRLIARKWIIWFLLAVAGISFLFIPAGLFAAIYYKWGGGWILAGLGGLIFFVAAGSAYFLDWIMWVWLAGFIVAVTAGLYWMFREHKHKHIKNQLVDTGELLKDQLKSGGKWNNTLKNDLMNLQSKTTRKAVLSSKIHIEDKEKKQDRKDEKKKVN